MIVGIISDIHANVYGLESALSALRKAKADHIICLGDVVGYYPFVNETIDLLRSENVTCILGNHDAAVIGMLSVDPEKRTQYYLDFTQGVIQEDHVKWLHSLPLSLTLSLDGLRIACFHGSPWLPLEEYIYPDYRQWERFAEWEWDYILLGHTHWPLVHEVDRVTVVNPGSCGQPRNYRPGSSYGLLDTRRRQVHLLHAEYDTKSIVDRLLFLGYDPKLIDILLRSKRT